MQWQNLLKKLLDNLGFLSADEKVSITNVAVIVFISITAFRSLFAGMNIHVGDVNWTVENIDVAGTLPLLFSLLNYANKRIEINKMNNNSQSTEDDKENQ